MHFEQNQLSVHSLVALEYKDVRTAICLQMIITSSSANFYLNNEHQCLSYNRISIIINIEVDNMKHTFKHFNGSTVEVDENGKKRIFYNNLEFKSIAAVNEYISGEEQVEKNNSEKI